MNELIILGVLQVMIWISIIIYRMLKKCMKQNREDSYQEEEELPPYEPPPPEYIAVTSNEHLVLQ